jgi:NodT family efflux transporter outer membrane factor (OMF) lipoprotein
MESFLCRIFMQKMTGTFRRERPSRGGNGSHASTKAVRPALRGLGWLAAAAFGCLLTGCVVGPKYHAPVTQAPTAFKETPPLSPPAGEWTVAQPQDAKLRGNWWEIFNDSELNDLEGQLNINNQNIKQFFENFMEARALIREARAQYFPTLTAAPSYSRSATSGNLVNSTSAAGSLGRTSTVFTLPGDVSWAPDLWGKVRNEVRNAQYSAQLSAADLENERLTEQATLAETFFEIRGQDALIKIFVDTVAADQRSLDFNQNAYDAGVGDYLNVAEAKSTLEAAESSETNLHVARNEDEHAIAVLVGKAASNFSIPVRPSLVAPPPIPIGIPSQLLERRPDVAGAERTMAAANAEIGVAYAAYYPTLTIPATGGFESSTIEKLLDATSRIWSVGPSASQIVYNGGLTRATINQFIATYNADLAAYRETVLTAFQQVEDNLSSTHLYSQQIIQQKQAVADSQQALDLEVGRYQTGIDPYIDVVTLQGTLLTNQSTLASLQVLQMTSAVALIEALGGGWDTSQLPTTGQVTAKPTKAETQIQQ